MKLEAATLGADAASAPWGAEATARRTDRGNIVSPDSGCWINAEWGRREKQGLDSSAEAESDDVSSKSGFGRSFGKTICKAAKPWMSQPALSPLWPKEATPEQSV